MGGGTQKENLAGAHNFKLNVNITLLMQVLANPNHTLHQFLPPFNSHHHHLRKRPHSHQLPTKRAILQQSNFIIRSLFNDTY